MLNKAAKEWIKSHPKEFVILGFKRLFNTYMVGDDVAYSIHGVTMNDTVKFKLFAATNCIRNMVFIPAIIYVLIYSIFILIQIIKRRTENLNKFNLYSTILFHMFTSVYFITEGQGRYAFPLIFIIIYFWVYFIKHGILLFKELKDDIFNIDISFLGALGQILVKYGAVNLTLNFHPAHLLPSIVSILKICQ